MSGADLIPVAMAYLFGLCLVLIAASSVLAVTLDLLKPDKPQDAAYIAMGLVTLTAILFGAKLLE